MTLMAVEEPLNGHTGDGRVMIFGDLGKVQFTLNFSVLTSLTMSTLVSSERVGANLQPSYVTACL